MNFFREFFFFSCSERRGILVLIALIVLVFLSEHLYRYWQNTRNFTQEELAAQQVSVREVEAFLTFVQESDGKRKEYTDRYSNRKNDSRLGKDGFPRSVAVAALFPFNPNRADSLIFRSLGLSGWMARNILRYREKGGLFRKVEDFRKIYGLTEEQYAALLPYIKIEEGDVPTKRMPQIWLDDEVTVAASSGFSEEQTDISSSADSTNALSLPSTPNQPFVRKYEPGTLVSLNRADTTELKRIPGIGSGIAGRIVSLRNRLGGFYRIEQLGEIHLDYHQLKPWFTIEELDIRRINVNRAGIEQLRRHPYINFYQAKALVDYRKKHGKLTSLKPFALLDEFTEEDLDRIGHYVCFEE